MLQRGRLQATGAGRARAETDGGHPLATPRYGRNLRRGVNECPPLHEAETGNAHLELNARGGVHRNARTCMLNRYARAYRLRKK